MISRTFSETDYINSYDLDEIMALTIEVSHRIIYDYMYCLYNIILIRFSRNQFLMKSQINTLIENIHKFKFYYFKPEGWKDLEKYLDYRTFTAEEINDLYIDLNLSYNAVPEIQNRNIWNYNYLLNWNEDSTIEWEE